MQTIDQRELFNRPSWVKFNSFDLEKYPTPFLISYLVFAPKFENKKFYAMFMK